MRNPFKDAPATFVVVQKPNPPIIFWAVASGLTFTPLPETFIALFSLIAFGSLFTWAWLEIFSGVNLFRKLLGVVVMITLLVLNL